MPDARPAGPTRSLRWRLLRVAVLPVLAVGALTAVLAATTLLRQAERDVAAVLERNAQGAIGRMADVSHRMLGYGTAIAQRRDVQEALVRRDTPALERELAELLWDLRSSDPLLRELAVADAAGEVLAAGTRGVQPARIAPEVAADAASGTRRIGVIDVGGTPMLGALLPVMRAGKGEVVGVARAGARLDAALAREVSAAVHSHVALFVHGRHAGNTLGLAAGELPGWLTRAAADMRVASGALRHEGEPYRVLVHPLADAAGKPVGAVAVMLHAEILAGPVRSAALALALTGLTILCVALPLIWRAARRLAQPLEALAETLRRMRQGDAVSPPVLPADTTTEIAALNDAVTRLHASLRERDELAGKLAWMANFDPVTRVPNRNLFNDRLSQALSLASRQRRLVALHMIDLDRFKEVNDTLGHAAGDAVLRQVGERLAIATRASDTVARLGGDEFAVIQTDIATAEDAATLAGRLVAALAQPMQAADRQAVVGASVGVALGSMSGPEAAEAIQREADLAMYRAKAEGRNCFRMFDSAMDLQVRDRRALEADLRRALEEDQLRLVFQPQHELPSRALRGAEALLRWRHPVRGEIRPDLFIPLAEEAGLIVPLGNWVLREAARAAATWPGMRIAVNVSPIQLRDPALLATLQQALHEAGIRGSQLEIEVTEGVMVTDTEATIALFDAVRALGVHVALDDFGTGYSSLAQLQRFRFDKIKLDRAFIHPLGRSQTAATLLRAVVGMTRALGVRLNAEGVETEAQLELLVAEGCAEAQGYLLDRPLERDDFAARVRAAEPRAAEPRAAAA